VRGYTYHGDTHITVTPGLGERVKVPTTGRLVMAKPPPVHGLPPSSGLTLIGALFGRR